MNRTIIALGVVLATAGCGPRLQKVQEAGSTRPTQSEAIIARANADGHAERARLADEAGAASAAAMASCAPEVCAAISRGELALGMTEDQVLAATRTTRGAWDIRGARAGGVMSARVGERAPKDGVSEVAFVSLQGGRVVGYTYREGQGFRTVSSRQDASAQGRAAAQADALRAEGDRAAASGDPDRALDLYDRADIVRPGDPETTLKIARVLDKQMRPLEALMRYQMFVHQMDLQKIEAHGKAAGHMADAIAQARQRIIVLERHR